MEVITKQADLAVPARFIKKNYSNDTLIGLYKSLLKPRLVEEKMLILLRQGKISKWFSGIGQEAISVGCAEALNTDEFMLTMHRNLGVFTSRNIPLDRLFGQFEGKINGYTKGRDRTFHFGTQEHHIVGMISHLGAQLGVADGIALANLLRNDKKVTLVFTGDGATSEGDFHEALNVAAVWNLPVIFVVEHNGYGLSTPNHEQFKFKNFTEKGVGYGMKAVRVDGNNVLEVYDKIREVAEMIRQEPQPVLVEAITFRMKGHEESSGTKYVPKELFEIWAKKDPILTYENYLFSEGILDLGASETIKNEIKNEIDQAWNIAEAADFPTANTQRELTDMYAPHHFQDIEPQGNLSKKRYIDAISDAIRQGMEKFENLILMGQDVAEYGGAFKVSEGMVEMFGKERIRNTPICESAIVGAGLGLSINGYKSIIEMQFADFVTCAFNQIINNLAKTHYRWGQKVDVVVRMPTGANTAAGPFHSQSNEAWFVHTAGLKVVYPSNPFEAKGLLLAAIEDPNPVIFFEHKYLYRTLSEQIPDDYYTLPIGKAKLFTEGTDLSIVTYGLCVHWAKEICEELGVSADILDLRTLLPWDKEAVTETVKKTGKVLVCHEDCLTGGIAGEIAAWIGEHLFTNLDAPVMREASLDTAVPFMRNLEQDFLPKQRMKDKILALLEY